MSTDRLSRWGALYVGSVTLLGACAIAQSAYTLYSGSNGLELVRLSHTDAH